MEQNTKDALCGIGLALGGGAVVYAFARWGSGLQRELGAVTLLRPPDPAKPPKRGNVNIGATWDCGSDLDTCEAVEFLQKRGYTRPQHLGEILKMFKTAVSRAEANPDNFVEFQLKPVFKTVSAADPGSPGSSGTARFTGGAAGKVYYDAKAKDTTKSWKTISEEFGKKGGTCQQLAKDYAEASGKPWPPGSK